MDLLRPVICLAAIVIGSTDRGAATDTSGLAPVPPRTEVAPSRPADMLHMAEPADLFSRPPDPTGEAVPVTFLSPVEATEPLTPPGNDSSGGTTGSAPASSGVPSWESDRSDVTAPYGFPNDAFPNDGGSRYEPPPAGGEAHPFGSAYEPGSPLYPSEGDASVGSSPGGSTAPSSTVPSSLPSNGGDSTSSPLPGEIPEESNPTSDSGDTSNATSGSSESGDNRAGGRDTDDSAKNGSASGLTAVLGVTAIGALGGMFYLATIVWDYRRRYRRLLIEKADLEDTLRRANRSLSSVPDRLRPAEGGPRASQKSNGEV